MTDIARAQSALQAIDPGCDRVTWVKVAMAAKAAGLSIETFDDWSSTAGNYGGEADCRSVWKSINGCGGIGPATLFGLAREAGWRDEANGHRTHQESPKPRPEVQSPSFDFENVWRDSEPATATHPYIDRKLGLPDGCRVYRGPRTIAGQALDGALLVPVHGAEGKLQSWQAIPPDGDKRSAPGAPIRGGRFMVGGPVEDVVYVVEGIGQAWSAHQASSKPAAVAFGAGNVEAIARALRAEHPQARIVIVADAGKESDAERIAAAIGGAWVGMPEGSAANFDLNDYHQQVRSLEAVADWLAQARTPEAPQSSSPLRIILADPVEVAAARLSPREILPGILFADVRLRAGAGGVSKTTLALYEAVMLALRRPVWGATPGRPAKTVLVTREDGRETMLARLREICRAMGLGADEQAEVFRRVAIIDLSGEPWRLTAVIDDVVVPNGGALDALVGELAPFAPDWIVFDPAVSFGTGEGRTNDAEQGLIEACRIIRNRLDCCVELIHHVGKQNARDGARDQYSFRGGSALADGARMVAILNPLEPDAWSAETGLQLRADEVGVVMSLAKMTFGPRPDDMYIIRRGFHFEQVTPAKQSPEQRRDGTAEQVLQFLRDQAKQGSRYSAGLLEDARDILGLSRKDIRAAVAVLLATGRVNRATGPRNAQWLEISGEPDALSVAEADGETHQEEVVHA